MRAVAHSGMRGGRWFLAIALLTATVAGARAMSFLCDDAFIAFRYVANAHEGHGLVWNPPPFAPVEGYTSFLWVLVLWATWALFGVAPPDSANWLSLLCGLATLGVVARMARGLRDCGGAPLPAAAVWLILCGTAGNRTFLSWLGSGLETALFGLCLVGWTAVAMAATARAGARWWAAWSLAAAATALARPDGLLCVAATGAVAMCAIVRGGARRAVGVGLLPLLLVGGHLLWRHATYGRWLPNTYYAKVVQAWPEAGARYFACFALEHGTWVCLLLAGAIAVRRAMARGTAAAVAAPAPLATPSRAALAVLAAHFAYYTLIVGGDHFEYRIYAHLVPLQFVGAAWLGGRLGAARAAIAATALLLVASTAGWGHLLLTREVAQRSFVPVAECLPAPLQPLGREYDRMQAWLRVRLICMRCGEHAAFLRRLSASYPDRVRMRSDAADVPVHAVYAAGIPGWTLPDVYVLDLLGLNDANVARWPVRAPSERPPQDQMDCMFAVADCDRDGTLSIAELRRVVLMVRPRDSCERPDFMASAMLALGRGAAPGVSRSQLGDLVDALAARRGMAHEHFAPESYLAAFLPNVAIVDREPVVRARSAPLSAARIVAIEADWRDDLPTATTQAAWQRC